MTQQTINIGTVADDRTGDPARDAFDKVNDNFTELYARAVPVPAFGTVSASGQDDIVAGELNDTLVVAAGANITLTTDPLTNALTVAASGTTGYATVQEDAAPLTQRDTLNFVGDGITASDDAGNSRTNVTLAANLNLLAALTGAADRLPYFTDVAAVALAVLTAAGRALLDDADAAAQRVTLGLSDGALEVTIDGGGQAITTGVKLDLVVPFDCTVTGWWALADQSGSIVIDVWKDSYANFPPTVADTITGSEKPTISAATKAQDTNLTTWTDVTLTKGEILRINVDSAATITRCTFYFSVTR